MDLAEVRRKYGEAVAIYRQGNAAEALVILDELDRAFPNAQKVTYMRVACLAALGRIDEAFELAVYLSDVLDDPRGQELQLRLKAARAEPGKPVQVALAQVPKPAKAVGCLACGCILLPMIVALIGSVTSFKGCDTGGNRRSREFRRARQTAPARPGRSRPRRQYPRRPTPVRRPGTEVSVTRTGLRDAPERQR